MKPLRPSDLAYVLMHLWERGQRELDGLALTREQAFAISSDWIGRGPSGALLADGEPVCFAGTLLGDPSCTWFQATEAFRLHAKAITKWLRKEIAAISGELVVYSQCIHPDTGKWFRLLGFEPEQWQGLTEAGKPLYRFRRR